MPSLLPPPFDPFAAPDQPLLDVPGIGVRLRPWRPDDDAVAELAAYQDEAIRRWHSRVVESDAEAREVVAGWHAGWSGGRESRWAVAGADDGVRGRGAVKLCDPQGVGAIAYWTAPSARGRGAAPAALRVVSAWAFDAGFHRLELVHSTANAPSCRVATKAGFAAEGVLRGAVLHTDGWHDMHLHARTAGDGPDA
jgi:[ribosomal protein S5]-alanine N-acetyltransferase